MGFEISERAEQINEKLKAFMETHIYPREAEYDDLLAITIIFGSIRIGMKA